jgi:hypothetical protein
MAKEISEECKSLIKRILNIFKLFHDFYFDPSYSNIAKLTESRYSLKNDIAKTKLSYEEKDLIDRYSSVFEIVFFNLKCVLALRTMEAQQSPI